MSDKTPASSPFWDEKYAAEGLAYGETPNAFLASCKDLLPASGKAFVPGDGEGRNGVWLAEQGLEVATIDLSAVAVDKAGAFAERRGVSVKADVANLLETDLPENAFDVIACIFLHLPSATRPVAHKTLAKALKPGGLLILEAYTPRQLEMKKRHGSHGGPGDADMLFTAEMLRADFSGLEARRLEEVERDVTEGRLHYGRSEVVQGVFAKPS